MKYPWSIVDEQTWREFMSDEDVDVVIERFLAGRLASMQPAATFGVQSLDKEAWGRLRWHLRVMAVWARGGRKVLRISAKAQQTLHEVTLDLAVRGFDPLRWTAVPNPGNDWYDVPLMLYLEPTRAHDGRPLAPLVTFVRSIGELFAERIEIAYWVEREGAWAPGKTQVPHVVTPEWWRRYEQPLSMYLRYGHLTGGLTVPLVGELHGVQLGMVCLAALAQETKLVIMRQPKARKEARRKGGSRERMVQYDLDESGLFVWRKKYIEEETRRRALRAEEEAEEPAPRGPMGLHQVQAHHAIYWVTSPGEEPVLATKEVNGKTYHAVLRPRKAHARGHGLHLNEGRVRVGATDI